jgi:hypothetical protein
MPVLCVEGGQSMPEASLWRRWLSRLIRQRDVDTLQSNRERGRRDGGRKVPARFTQREGNRGREEYGKDECNENQRRRLLCPTQVEWPFLTTDDSSLGRKHVRKALKACKEGIKDQGECHVELQTRLSAVYMHVRHSYSFRRAVISPRTVGRKRARTTARRRIVDLTVCKSVPAMRFARCS